MTKQQILDEIRRTAKQNGVVALGHKRFEQETGIRHADWWGKHWGRWGDAVTEAGLSPNTLQDAFSDDILLEKLIAFIRELGRFPGNGDLRLKKRKDPAFPNDKVFDAHFGSRAQLRACVVDHCRSHPGHDEVPTLCGPVNSDGDDERGKPSTEVVGFVYLMKAWEAPQNRQDECHGTTRIRTCDTTSGKTTNGPCDQDR
jgi:hypothetical protein